LHDTKKKNNEEVFDKNDFTLECHRSQQMLHDIVQYVTSFVNFDKHFVNNHYPINGFLIDQYKNKILTCGLSCSLSHAK
jgi:hypothetical protein